MTATEKRVLFERINEQLESNETESSKILSPWSLNIFSTWIHASRFAFAVTMALILALTGGTLSYAAESSLPGDLLYPIKVKVTEPVRDVLAVKPEVNAKWQVEKTERRMQEIETLSVQDKLDDKKEKDINELITKHTKDLNESLNNLREHNLEEVAHEISVNFEVGMNAHAEVLDTIEGYSTTRKSKDSSVAKNAREKAKDVREKNSKNFHREENRKSVEIVIEETFSDIENLATNTTPFRKKVIEGTQDTLNKAKKSYKESLEKKEKGEREESYRSLLDSERSVQEARIFMKRGFEIEKQLHSEGKDKKEEKRDKSNKDRD
jgi:hypothetical protein